MATLTTNILSLNLSVITAVGNLNELRSLLNREYVDIVLLQEVAIPAFDFYGYSECVNLGPDKRGTALLWKSALPISDVCSLPSGRAIAATFGDVRIVCVYAPSGTSGAQERRAFFAQDLALLFAEGAQKVVLGGDFNCVLEAKDTTGGFRKCAELQQLVSGLGLCDTWRTLSSDPGYTYHSAGCRSRLDRIYVSSAFKRNIKSVHRHTVTFGNHQAVSAHVELQVAYLPMGPSYWKAARYTFRHRDFLPLFKAKWREWEHQQRRYKDIADWWDLLAKPRIQSFCKWFAKEYWKEQKGTMDFYRQCLDELYAKRTLTAEDHEEIRELRDKIGDLLRAGMSKVCENDKSSTPCGGEEPSMYTVISAKKKRESRTITRLEGEDGGVHTTQQAISTAIVTEFSSKFSAPVTPLDLDCPILEDIQDCLSPQDRQALAADVTAEELLHALKKSPRNKSPGSDGLPAEFYTVTWDVIGTTVLQVVNTVLQRGRLCRSMLVGIMVLLPKVAKPATIKHYRPLTMLNADYKLIARVIAVRMTAVVSKAVHPMVVQFGGQRNISAALCDLRDVVAYHGLVQRPGCLLSADIVGAFDNVRHDFLFEVLRRMGFGSDFVAMMKTLYNGGQTRVQVNGYISRPFPVESSVRQGCPVSAVNFTCVISVLIQALHQRLTGLQEGAVSFKATAYADDVTVLLGSAADVDAVQEVFGGFAAVSGLAVSCAKTKAIPLGTWDPAEFPLPYDYVDNCRILGVIFARTVPDMINLTWSKVVSAANAVVHANYGRTLNLVQKVWFASTYVLSKLWYVAQVLPPPKDSVERLQSLVAGWLWAGSFFRVPFRLVCAPRSAGGLGLLHPYWKAQSLFIGRWLACLVQDAGSFAGTILEVLADRWPLTGDASSCQIPDCVIHYREYFKSRKDRVLALPLDEGARALHRAVYEQLLGEDPPDPPRPARIAGRPVQWDIAWHAISRSWHGSATRSRWYTAVHDVVATECRLHAVGRVQSANCARCGARDTLLHRLTECGAAGEIWGWVRRAIGPLPNDILIRPDMRWQPKQRCAAHQWVLGKTVRYVLEEQIDTVSLRSFHRFLKEAHGQLDTATAPKRFGTYLKFIINVN
ncbi:Transposon TX1 uncharacterized 149 kDa protein [Frankliniella fusca]|uniref:Transposon TX1 uncharacterized 149 kDa protein n=1 Tax=Frankliniella fusca TaxID=407009 RepID=A0AAE1HLL1_9NEOP|nr:Transposon TX1 uncharacterized 149 kDa protein [Frankliniella fusca]